MNRESLHSETDYLKPPAYKDSDVIIMERFKVSPRYD